MVTEEWVRDAAFVDELDPVAKIAALLGFGLRGDPTFGGSDSSVDAIQEEIVGGSGTIVKVEGACGRVRRNEVR